MWIAAVIMAYGVLSLAAALVFYCTAALAGRMSENSSLEDEVAGVKYPAESPAPSTETLTIMSKSSAQESAAHSQ